MLLDAAAMLLGVVRYDLRPYEAAEPPKVDTPQLSADRATRKVKRKASDKATRATKPRERQAGAEPAAAVAPVEANGVSVNLSEGAESVTFKGKTLSVSDRQARFILAVARGMPNPVDRSFIAKKVWPSGKVPEFYEQILGQFCSTLADPMATIGLRPEGVRGVGIVLKEIA